MLEIIMIIGWFILALALVAILGGYTDKKKPTRKERKELLKKMMEEDQKSGMYDD